MARSLQEASALLPIVDMARTGCGDGCGCSDGCGCGAAAPEPPRTWRSLEEWAQTDEFKQWLQREFPEKASEWSATASRREFLALMGASIALAGAAGCGRQPEEPILPYVRQPELIVPGQSLYFATAISLGKAVAGLLVASQMGRPIKIEGNPRHPGTPAALAGGSGDLARGVSDIFSQAAILTLYDPDRSRSVRSGGRVSTWEAFLASLRRRLGGEGPASGGIRILTEAVVSPTLRAQLADFTQAFDDARWIEYEPINDDAELAGTQATFGESRQPRYDLAAADVVLALDFDFLHQGPQHLQLAFDLAQRRRPATGSATPGQDVQRNGAQDSGAPDNDEPRSAIRLYAVESLPSPTGLTADHRLPLRPDEIIGFVQVLGRRLGAEMAAGGEEPALSPAAERFAAAVADDLREAGSAALVMPGPYLPARVHAWAQSINRALGSGAVQFAAIGEAATGANAEADDEAGGAAGGAGQSNIARLRRLVEEMNAGQVETLLILGGNPAYASPGDLDFAESMNRVPYRVHLSQYFDETSARCHWHVPQAHFLETWGDVRALDGTVTIQQPLIDPLHGGRSACELLSALLDERPRSGYELIRDHWEQAFEQGEVGPGAADGADSPAAGEDSADFDTFWQTSLHEGVMPGTSAEPSSDPASGQGPDANGAALDETGFDEAALEEGTGAAAGAPSGHRAAVLFRPDPCIWDGRFANNGWLQELPKPLSKLVWDNPAWIGPAMAERLGLKNGDMVELRRSDTTLRIPVFIVPGQVDGTLTLFLGYGRTRAGRVGNGRGLDVYRFQDSRSPWRLDGVEIVRTGETYPLAATQHHFLMEGRDLVRTGTHRELAAEPDHPEFMADHHIAGGSLYPEYEYNDYKWGMSIDLNRCFGCNACVIACQAENNIPVVGKDQVRVSREMHWIRVDQYYQGEPDNPRVVNQPLPCMHCEKAPCEVVCPVMATVHDGEGLNEMIYNRCVGTRYCSNNCPYKVRRFNYLQYAEKNEPSLQLLYNPDVTVRDRGVMEKCTYCIQRISSARIAAGREQRRIREGEVYPACAMACPSQAIMFGDMNLPRGRISQWKDDPRNYGLLAELGTQPRTTYLAHLRNPNPRLSGSGVSDAENATSGEETQR